MLPGIRDTAAMPLVGAALPAGASSKPCQVALSYQYRSCTEPFGATYQSSMLLGMRDTAAMPCADELPAGESVNPCHGGAARVMVTAYVASATLVRLRPLSQMLVVSPFAGSLPARPAGRVSPRRRRTRRG